MVKTNRRIKVPDIEFGEFLWFIKIWMLITENSDTIQTDYFRKTVKIFSLGAQFL